MGNCASIIIWGGQASRWATICGKSCTGVLPVGVGQMDFLQVRASRRGRIGV